jgi:hypothetical protein
MENLKVPKRHTRKLIVDGDDSSEFTGGLGVSLPQKSRNFNRHPITTEKKSCRICLEEDYTSSNPFVTPC